MKQRITYVVRNPDSFTPEQLSVKNDAAGATFTLKDIDAVKEHRITIGLDELPGELSTSLTQWNQLHIRWASERAYSTIPPFTSRVSPGLHIFFTPLETTPPTALCHALHAAISPDLKCASNNETAIQLPKLSDRFSMSTASQYYTHLPSLEPLLRRLNKTICPTNLLGGECTQFVASLLTASYLDVDYDTISRALVVTAFWADAPSKAGWTETIAQPHADARVEVGILVSEPNPDPEDIQFGGFLTVVGEDEKPTPPNPTCKLHAHITLPSALFIDKHQFTDPLFLDAHNLRALRSLAGAADLEAPDWVVPQWGSAGLVELASPPSDDDSDSDPSSSASSPTPDAEWKASIPLHARYLPPSQNTSHSSIPLPWPVVFWACRSEAGAKMAASPFERVHLGYEALFGGRTRFLHVQPGVAAGDVGGKDVGRGLIEYIPIPVLDRSRAAWVQSGTVGAVFVAFLGLCWVLWGKGLQNRNKGSKEKKTQ
ncbi:PIG-X-domain-containing protein [Dothidotthia symphoricarpi CBS 119687]|uniref:Protein PBN1 n=1 Tax=Dothidotthia symphoricarpi CBS 119687 TaxID=1392245 RepID=A0A6A6A8J2_9PLEO|nr:PIG-X-domain-containing protein [Dothidotthia symphoricarpi CBS 119687]KAF2128292.1 PIG-X-domain-containing protein [Dothidotthia symphoricarpi CBS 119687]